MTFEDLSTLRLIKNDRQTLLCFIEAQSFIEIAVSCLKFKCSINILKILRDMVQIEYVLLLPSSN